MDNRQFEQAVQQYSDMVFRIAYSYFKNKEDAEDIYQNVFFKLFDNKKTFHDEEHRKRWLIRVTLNECHSLQHSPWKRKRQDCEDMDRLLEEKADKEDWQFPSSDMHEVTEMLHCLPEKYSIVLYLYYYEEYSTKEIAVILKRAESTIRTQLMRGKEMLKKKMFGKEN